MENKYCIENDFAAQKELAEIERHNTVMIWEENKRLKAELSALVEAVKKIKKYARHYPDCNESESPFCQCGLEAARAEVDRLLAEGRDELNPLMEEAKRSHITKTMEEGK